MSRQLSIDEFATHILSQGNNATRYKDKNNFQITQDWLKENPGDRKYLLPDEISKLKVNNLSTDGNLKSAPASLSLNKTVEKEKPEGWQFWDTSLYPELYGNNWAENTIEGSYQLISGGLEKKLFGEADHSAFAFPEGTGISPGGIATGLFGSGGLATPSGNPIVRLAKTIPFAHQALETAGAEDAAKFFYDYKPIATSMMNSLNLMFDNHAHMRNIVNEINVLQNQVDDPNFMGNKEYILSHSIPHKRRMLDNMIDQYDPDNPKSLRRLIYEDYTLPVSIAMNEEYGQWFADYMKNNKRYAKIAKWYEGEEINSWGDLVNPHLWAAAFGDFIPSIVASRLPGGQTRLISGTLKAVSGGKKASGLTKTAKVLDNVADYMDPIFGTGMLYMMESLDLQQNAFGYLKDEFEWVDADGNKQVGLPIEDALMISSQVGFVYGLISSALEKAQMNRFADYVGATKNARRSLIHNLVSNAYNTIPKSRTGRLIYEGWDFLGIAAQEGWTEGVQAYMGVISIEALKNGYDINDPIGFKALVDDMGIEMNEAGIGSLLFPWGSDNPEIQQSARKGSMGGGTGGAVNVIRHTSGLAVENDVASFKADMADGDDVIAVDVGGGVIVHNFDSDQSTVIPTGNQLETDEVLNSFQDDADDLNTSIKIIKKINNVDDYLTSIINNTLDRKGYQNQDIISNNPDDWSDYKALNAIQKLFVKDSKGRKGNEEYDWVKIANLIQLTGDKDLLNRAMNDGKLDKEDISKLKILQSLTIKEIKKRAVKILNNQYVESDLINDVDAQNQLISLLNNKNFMTDKEIIESFAAGQNILEEVIAQKVNQLEDPDITIAFKEDFIQTLITPEITQDDINQSIIDANQEEIQSALGGLDSQSGEINKIEALRTNNKIVDLKAKSATGAQLYGHIGGIFLDTLDDGGDPVLAVKKVLEDTIDATRLRRLLDELGIKYKNAQELGTPKGKKKYINLIAKEMNQRIVEGQNLKLDKVKKKKVTTVVTPKTKMEKDIIKEEQVDKKRSMKIEIPSGEDAGEVVSLGEVIDLADQLSRVINRVDNATDEELRRMSKEQMDSIQDLRDMLPMLNEIIKNPLNFVPKTKKKKVKKKKVEKKIDAPEGSPEAIVQDIIERIKELDKKAQRLDYDTVLQLSLNRGNKRAQTKIAKKILEAYDAIVVEAESLDWYTARLLPQELFTRWAYPRGGSMPNAGMAELISLYAYLISTDNVENFEETTGQSLPSEVGRQDTLEEKLEGLKRQYMERAGTDEEANKEYHDNTLKLIEQAIDAGVQRGEQEKRGEGGVTAEDLKSDLQTVFSAIMEGGGDRRDVIATMIALSKDFIKVYKIPRKTELKIRNKVKWKKDKTYNKYKIRGLTLKQAEQYLSEIIDEAAKTVKLFKDEDIPRWSELSEMEAEATERTGEPLDDSDPIKYEHLLKKHRGTAESQEAIEQYMAYLESLEGERLQDHIDKINRVKAGIEEAMSDRGLEMMETIAESVEYKNFIKALEKPDEMLEVTIMGETETMTRAEAERQLAALKKAGPSVAEDVGAEAAGMEDIATAEEIRGLEAALGVEIAPDPAAEELDIETPEVNIEDIQKHFNDQLPDDIDSRDTKDEAATFEISNDRLNDLTDGLEEDLENCD